MIPSACPRAPRLAPALLLGCLLVTGCIGPPSHLTRVWPEGGTGEPLLGLSTEDGVLLLAEPQWQVGDLFELHFPVGNSHVRDWGRLDRRNDDLAVVRPISSRLREGRFATTLPDPEAPLYLALRDADDDPEMVPVERWHEGRLGNWIVPPDGDAEALAHDWAGAGLYVLREWRWFNEDRWEIVGMLSDVTARLVDGAPGDVAVGVIDIAEISRILPDQVDYFVHPIHPPRPDFEFGVPLQDGDIVLPDEPEAPTSDGSPEPGGGARP